MLSLTPSSKPKKTLLFEKILEKGYFTITDMENVYHRINDRLHISMIKGWKAKSYIRIVHRGGRVLYIRGDKFPLKIPE